MSAASTIARKGRPITLRRFSSGTYSDGYYNDDAAPMDSSIVAVVQPMSGREKLLLPEGDRVKEWIKLWTVAEVRTMTETSRADQVIVNGKSYEIQIIQDWFLPAGGANLTHYECSAVSVNEKTNSI